MQHWAYLSHSVSISTFAIRPKVILRYENFRGFGGWKTDNTSKFFVLPLQIACTAVIGLHKFVPAENPFPVPPGMRQRGIFLAVSLSSLCKRACIYVKKIDKIYQQIDSIFMKLESEGKFPNLNLATTRLEKSLHALRATKSPSIRKYKEPFCSKEGQCQDYEISVT